jgi:GTP-binding protein HflX
MDVASSRREKVVLVGCALKSLPRASATQSPLSLEESLDELASLTASAGGAVVERVLQEREQYDSAYLIGSGKLRELEESAREFRADVVIFDENLSPAQQRNIERKIGCRVIDRTQLILDIFASRARTREGKLQVELAQLDYMLPRLAGRGVELSRLGGGIGTRGPGETKLESDQRKIHKRIHKIKEDLERVRSHRGLHRAHRHSIPVPTVSLVGYTNAGKSTLFNALTSAGAFASNQLFATLDPLLRRIKLPSNREVILSDTVGFIHKLPTTLVSAFRATLEEVAQADLLLHVIDVSSPHAEQQREAVLRILEELEVSSKPTLEVYNKIDLSNLAAGRFSKGNSLSISAIQNLGLDKLLHRVDKLLSSDPLTRAKFLFKQTDGNLLSKLYSCSRLIEKSFVDDQVLIEVEAPRSVVERLKKFQVGA